MTDGDEGQEDHPTAPGRRTRPVLVLAVSLAVVLAVVAAVLAVLLAADEDDGDADIRRAAGEFGELFVSYDHEDPDAHRDAVLARSTGAFRGEYEAAFDEGLSDLITELGATSQGFLKDVYLTEAESGQALAIVVLDIETDGASGPNTLFDVYIRLTLVSVDGRWLVDDVTDLSFGGSATGPSEGSPGATPTSSTSVP